MARTGRPAKPIELHKGQGPTARIGTGRSDVGVAAVGPLVGVHGPV